MLRGWNSLGLDLTLATGQALWVTSIYASLQMAIYRYTGVYRCLPFFQLPGPAPSHCPEVAYPTPTPSPPLPSGGPGII